MGRGRVGLKKSLDLRGVFLAFGASLWNGLLEGPVHSFLHHSKKKNPSI